MRPGLDSNRSAGQLPARAAGILLATLCGAESAAADRPAAVDWQATYSGEMWRNTRGGVDTDEAYLDNLGVTLELDPGALWGWSGARILLEGMYNNGHSLSAMRTGDLQTVSNIDTDVSHARVYQALIEAPLGDSASWLFGLYDLNSEFDVLESANLFLHSAHGIGTDIGQTGRNGPSIFPINGLGLRLAWRFNDTVTARGAALDGVPGDPDHPDRASLRLDGDEGALLAGEVEHLGERHKLLAGAWRYTADHETWSTGGTGQPRTGSGNQGAYLRGEWLATDTFTLFARWGTASPRFNVFQQFLGVGFNRRAPLPGRPGDTFGMALAWAEAGEAYRKFQASTAAPADRREVALEITYRMALTDRFALQPDIQYVHNPGLISGRSSALAVGLRASLVLD